MKLKTLVAVAAVAAVNFAFASGVAVVDLKTLFHKLPQVAKISKDIKHRFEPQHKAIVKLSKEMRANVKKMQKNHSVMTKAEMKKLQETVSKEAEELHNKQAAFEQNLYKAQSAAMHSLLNKVRATAGNIARSKGYDAVLASQAALYAKADITNEVLKKLS